MLHFHAAPLIFLLLVSCFAVEEFSFVFRIDDSLILVQTVIARHSIADGNSNHKVRNTACSEQLKAYKQRGDRTVCDTAEHCDDADSSAERR